MEVDGAGEPGVAAEPGPSQTLYVHNLSERVRKEELKKCLRAVFRQFGTILDVVLCKAYKLRGQAWVVFASAEEAAEAKALMEGFPLYEKPLRLAYARTKSDVLAKADGSFVPRPAYDKTKRKAEVKVEINKKRRAKEAAAAAAPPAIASAPPPRVAPTIAPAAAPFAPPALGGRPPYGMQPAPYGLPAHMEGPPMPHKILFVQGLPETVAASVLTALFTQFPGFREVRLIEARPGIAFVEYEAEPQAGAALAGLQAFKIDEDHVMSITYAKR